MMPTSTTPAMITPETTASLSAVPVGPPRRGDPVSLSAVSGFENPPATSAEPTARNALSIAYHRLAMTDTNQVRLRAVELHDLAFTRKCRNDPRVHLPALGRRFPITEVGEEAWFRSLGQGSPPEVTYIVARATDEVAIGLTTLRQIDWINRTAMFGVWIS